MLDYVKPYYSKIFVENANRIVTQRIEDQRNTKTQKGLHYILNTQK
jgi:uncharacterized protein (UPF0305 family)